MVDGKTCAVQNCEGLGDFDRKTGSRYFKKGYCSRHYQRFKKYGDPLYLKAPSDNRSKHALYPVYKGMRLRTRSKDLHNSHRYTGRGISICERWLDQFDGFWNFVEDMGARPDGYSIDRIDNNKGYSPENCRWATPLEQSLNTKNVEDAIRLEYEGDEYTVRELSLLSGIPKSTLYMRIFKYGWTIDEAVNIKLKSRSL